MGEIEPRLSSVPGADGDHVTYCRTCEALCGMVATVKGGQVTKVTPDHDNPHSKGHICVKGPAMADVTSDPDRVIYPMKRDGSPGRFKRVSWDEALDDIGARLGDILAQDGPDAFASVFGNPASFGIASMMAPGLFQQAIGSTKTFSPTTEDIASAMLAHQLLFENGSWIFPDLPNCDHLLIFGSNPLISHGSLMIAPRIREDLDDIARRGRITVIDPRKTETAKKFHHVPIKPNTDVWLLAAMIHVLFREDLADTSFLSSMTTGWEDLRAAVASVTPEAASMHCGVAAEDIRSMALAFARNERAAAMGRTGLCRGRFATLSNVLLLALNIVAGKFHRVGGVGFGHGASDSGEMLSASGLSGYRPGASRTSGLPSLGGSLPSVTLRDEMMLPGPGRVRALFVTGANPVMSMPGGSKLVDGFKMLDLMVSFDIYMTETNKHADYILPGPTQFEREDVPLIFFGHMVRPFVQYVPAVLPPRGEVRSEFDVYKEIAARLGKAAPFELSPMEIVDAALRSGPEGQDAGEDSEDLSLDDLKAHPHGFMLKRGRWAFELSSRLKHADGKIHLWAPLIEAEFARLQKEDAQTGGGLRLFSSRKLRSINSWMHNVERLVRSDAPKLLIHPDDAADIKLSDGQQAELTSKWGSIVVDVELSEDVIRGGVTYPHGWGHEGGWQRANAKSGANVNAIAPSTPDTVEQISGMSFLDGFEVTVRPF